MTPRINLLFLFLSIQFVFASCRRDSLPEPSPVYQGRPSIPTASQPGPTSVLPSLSVPIQYFNPQPDCVITGADSIINMVTYVQPSNEGTSRTQFFDLDADGTSDLVFTNSTSYSWVSNTFPQNNHQYMFNITSQNNHMEFLATEVGASSIYNAVLMAAGSLVDSNSATWVSGTQLVRQQNSQPTLFNQEFSGTKYIGFRLRNSSGQWQYGWMKLSRNIYAFAGMYYIYLEEWAFNQSSGFGIMTGQTL